MTTRGSRYWSSGSLPLIAPDLLGDIIATASDVAIVISDVGKILSVLINPAHASYGRLDHWEGRDIRDVLTVESVPKLESRLGAISGGEFVGRPIELNHSDSYTWEFPVRYSFHSIGPDGALLMLGRDLRPIAEMQQQLVKAQMALERDYEAKREFDTRYRVLMEATRDAMVFVNIASGRIADLNAAAALQIGGSRDDLLGAAFAQEFEGRKRGEFLENLTSAAIADSDQPIDLTARRSRKKLLVTPSVFRAAGERLLLCRIETADGTEGVSDQLAENLGSLFQDGADGMVFTDRSGIILSANESFLNLADVAHLSNAKGKSLSDYLARGAVDLKVLTDNASRSGQMRLYATKLSGEYGAQVSVEISATYLNDRASPCFAFVMRDASRVDALRRPGMTANAEGMKSVMELVGSASLKDIVAETTDVVEKMCIETAVELTRNNRVAAAEMLGLSRQSLYVKLRKYGLVNKDSS
ncbi:transcriptional regulator PpsR [Anianabacter salinae]|uniref:transcriptional regulator PpsR n=1 Tax=Anianabacter salinae TaxID=2851023 RepID=UPI00225E155C|nr:transcriptional regulator PpsR [Anianabacter salinae]MBV0914199.1 transcriptional regulator PpsR [Anianabacter salinae]